MRGAIVSTLAILYTIATLAVLALAGTYLYVALKSELLLRDTATVSHQVRRLRHTVGEAAASDTPERWGRRWAEHAGGDPRFQARALDASGSVVAETAGMPQPQSAFPAPVGPDALPSAGLRWNDPGKNKFLLVAGQALSKDGKPYTVQVAMDLTDSKEVLDGYRVKVGIMLLVGGLCAGLIGYFVARRSVQPLIALAEEMKASNPATQRSDQP